MVGRIGPGERALVAPLQIGFDKPSEPKVLQVTTIVDHYAQADDLSGCETFSLSEGVQLEVVSTAIQRGEYSSSVTGQVKNPTTRVVDTPSVNCILRAGAAIVGGISTSIMDPIPPGGTIAFDAGTLGFMPASATSAECQIVA